MSCFKWIAEQELGRIVIIKILLGSTRDRKLRRAMIVHILKGVNIPIAYHAFSLFSLILFLYLVAASPNLHHNNNNSVVSKSQHFHEFLIYSI